MNFALLTPDVRAYLMEHLQESETTFLLRSHPFKLDVKELSQQLIGLQKARKKFPVLFDNENILFPPKTNLEQTSSWVTALYKAQLISGSNMIDLTGGLGIDAIAFSTTFKDVTHVELDQRLQEIASHNFKALSLPIESYNQDGIRYLENSQYCYDLIYIDPSRKTSTHSKAIDLTDYEPDVTIKLTTLLSKSPKILIKTSPMLDITAGLKQLENVEQIQIVAVKNEVKELLWVVGRVSKPTEITAVNLSTDQDIFQYNLNTINPVVLGELGDFLYEPNAAIMKTQAFGEICHQYPVTKLDHNTSLFSGSTHIKFPGRTFKVLEVLDYKPKLIKRQYGKGAYTVVTRNFRESVANLRKKFNLREHHNSYLFFTKLQDQGQVVIKAERID